MVSLKINIRYIEINRFLAILTTLKGDIVIKEIYPDVKESGYYEIHWNSNGIEII
ncbi:MAG: hypothetical protein Ta2E_11520 [Mycoplasmoidaceae bacterium]|nr:MAG: hypothetical protein Ta2E_11520 [Mycoplasmoidaceae bacterium]